VALNDNGGQYKFAVVVLMDN